MDSFATTLNRDNGIGPGFDFLRVFLAISIFATHAYCLAGDFQFFNRPFWLTVDMLVPSFFALSGFLVTASAIRLSLKNFLISRCLRIVPALGVDVFVCALLIGPIFTTFSLKDYATDGQFLDYFTNIIGNIHYKLPGVFETNLDQQVNGSLWTVPYEGFCYAIISFLIIIKWLHAPNKTLTLMIFLTILGIGYQFLKPISLVSLFLESKKLQLILAFLCGVVAFQFKEIIPYNRKIFWCVVALWVTASCIYKNEPIFTRVETRFILLPMITYATIFVGLTKISLPSFCKQGGNYSYGIYLYHYPIMQCVVSLFPKLCTANWYGACFLFIVSFPLVVLVAALSWHFVEKPALSLRRKFFFVAQTGKSVS